METTNVIKPAVGFYKPAKFKHDVETDRSLGAFLDCDLYIRTEEAPNDQYARVGESLTVLARNGNDPENYVSGLTWAHYNPALWEALRRAALWGLITVTVEGTSVATREVLNPDETT